MTWKIKGKIGLHFPNAGGNPNQDTYRIVYSSDGVQSNLQEIKKVYFLTPADASYISSLSTTEAQLAELTSGKYDVWERYWEEPPSQKKLVAGTQNVAIEYDMTDATEDLVINSIEIFTDSSSTSSAKIKILHESGVFIAAIDGDNRGSETEKYEMTGRTRSVNGLNITLYKGHKYYFVYQGDTNEAFYPAYFQGDTDGNYKLYSNTTAATQINVGDLSVLGNFLGGLFQNRHPTKDDKVYLLSLNINDSFMYLGYNDAPGWDPRLVQNHFYKRKSKTYNNVTTVSITSGNDHYKAAKLFGNIKKYTTILQNGQLTNGGDYDGNIAEMAKDYTSYIDVDTNNEPIALTTLPSNPQDKGLYYIDGSVLPNGRGQYDYEFVVYHNNNWDRVGQWYMSQAQINDYINYPDWWNKDFEDLNVNYTVDSNFANKSVETPGKHFYLKLNNIEV